jgi:hypothetical protein
VKTFDLGSVPLLDHHSHAGLYERRLGRHQRLADLDTADPHYASSTYRVLALARGVAGVDSIQQTPVRLGLLCVELYYTAAVNGRRQLGRALQDLIASGGLTRPEAVQVAERVCFRNTATLYGLADV